MEASVLASKWQLASYRLFTWRCGLSIPEKLVFALGLACLTGLAAQVRVVLFFTPVPITGQVFAVLLSGVMLGSCYGGLSQAFYLGIGAAGVPWFTGACGGLPLGPTGGYLIGFVPAAALVGWLTDRHVWLRGVWGQTALMMTAVGIIYLFGAAQFAVVMQTGLRATLAGAVLPFIPLDLAKALAVAVLTASVLPKVPYGGKSGGVKREA
jgi:biotin transport system substrate-specific component